ncbi:MAG TPA: hypothetical protein PLB41_10920 [Rubrivivax sp.]|nr:hypothetical protein [Rubrivivax sp.]HPO17903.1 hypothetical protein [Rubrivivax sp.]
MTALLRILLLAGAVLAAGCDALGIESAQAQAERRDADGKAVGGACRHAGRAIEDCYALNRKADRAAVFAGWREMNDYMRENKIDTVAPLLGGSTALAGRAASAEGGEPQAGAGTSAGAKRAAHGS